MRIALLKYFILFGILILGLNSYELSQEKEYSESIDAFKIELLSFQEHLHFQVSPSKPLNDFLLWENNLEEKNESEFHDLLILFKPFNCVFQVGLKCLDDFYIRRVLPSLKFLGFVNDNYRIVIQVFRN